MKWLDIRYIWKTVEFLTEVACTGHPFTLISLLHSTNTLLSFSKRVI